MVTVHEVQQGTDEWLKLREGKYTGSNAEKLLKYANQYKLVNGVLKPYAINEITGFTGNFYTRRGHTLEEKAIEVYERVFGVTVDRPGFVTNDLYPMCGYSPDGFDSETLLEVKCFTPERHRELLRGNIPVKILAQIYFGLVISEKRQAKLIPFNPDLPPGEAFKAIPIEYNQKIIDNFKRVLGGAI